MKYLVGVKIGKGVLFQGRIIINKCRNSNIMIGNNNTFISRVNGFNLIGINRPCILNTQREGAKIEIGNDCGFSGTVIGASIFIKIGNNVKVGANSLITDSDWHPEDSRSGMPSPVIIDDNVWIGANVVVLKGVKIGKNSFIGANSLVTKSIPDNSLACGNPCKVIKEYGK